MWLRILIGLGIVFMGAILAAVFPRVFSLPPALHRSARLAVLITAATLACTLTFGISGAVLSALHRFDLLSGMNILRALLRASGFVWLLRHGYGIVSLALWEFLAALVVGIGLSLLCAHSYPELRLSLHRPEKEIVRKVWGYGIHISLITLAAVFIYHTDNIVVGLFAGSAAVTFYAIAGNLVASSAEAVAAVSATFTPMASGFQAEDKFEHLRRLLIQGTRASLMVGLPICLALFVRGHTFIALWMGHEYAPVSGVILQILLVNRILTTANMSGCSIAYGMEKQRPIVAWALVEALANLALSVLLVRRIGIYGVAWGTAIAGVICNLLFWPRYIGKFLHIAPGEYLWEGWGAACLAAVPFASACYWEERYWKAPNLAIFFLQITAVLPLLLLTMFALFRKEILMSLRGRWPLKLRSDCLPAA